MRIKVDYQLCESNAICVGMAPDVFDLDDEDVLQVLQGSLRPEQEEEIQHVVACCPTGALSLVSESDPGALEA